jgi:hypothetical protein
MRMRTLVVAALIALACTDSAGPPQQLPTGQLHFLVQDATAPALLSDTASFYAKVGEDRRVELFYRGLTSDTGESFLRFEVHAASLLKRPDGSSFQPGDSILITCWAIRRNLTSRSRRRVCNSIPPTPPG